MHFSCDILPEAKRPISAPATAGRNLREKLADRDETLQRIRDGRAILRVEEMHMDRTRVVADVSMPDL
jgi:hypothetical protein